MSIIDMLFGKQKTPKELMREYKRSVERSIRELEREREKMQQQEKKLIADMKRLAKQNQMEPVKIMAKDLVRTRHYVTKFYRMKAQLQAVSLKLTTLSSTAEMTNAMKGVARTMQLMNKQMDLPSMQKIMRDFAQQSEMMDMKEEMVGDMMDDVMAEDGDEDEEEGLVAQVLDEIGLDMSGQIGDTPSGKMKSSAKEEAEDDDLQARLEKLKK
ncbi:vacuolar protein sorting protein VPS2 [Acrasis kona]|uniref:Vacuolar protein sorting protein VPS2 n=1 Tax=Acrasis kona TaxID=1008807 RepID=A0AAW2ZIM2_9EUKA